MDTAQWKMPEQCMRQWYSKLRAEVKTAFFCAVILGLMAHLYQFTNKLYNYDELVNTPGGIGLSIEQGRWFLKWMGQFMNSVLGGAYSFPLFNGCISLLLLAVSAALVVSALEIRNPLTAGIVGGLFAVFPAVISMYFFMFSALYYSIAIFFSVLAAYLTIKYPRSILWNAVAVLLIACSLGTYQAYFPNTVCILLIAVILKAAFGNVAGKEAWKTFWLMVARFCAVMAAGLVAYLLINKVVLAVTGIQLTDYQGASSMGSITLSQLIGSVKQCYASFFGLGFEDVMGINYNRTLKRLVKVTWLLLGAGLGSYLILKKENYLNKLIVVCGFVVFPIALFLIYVMAPSTYCYTLMTYPVVFFFIFCVVWVDACWENLRSARGFYVGMNWVASLTMAAIIITYIWYANGNYMALEYTKYHDMAYCQTLITQIKSVEGYTEDMPVVIVGQQVSDSTNSLGSLVGDTFIVGGRSESNLGYNSLIYITAKYLGFSPEYAGYEETQEWMARDEVRDMPSYPDEGSIQVIDGTIIVKLSDYE